MGRPRSMVSQFFNKLLNVLKSFKTQEGELNDLFPM
jgi:hypothetical protein